ncbi:hypothetical protein HY493_05895 [Candidatus Woesearchaeota archaeon]|nr:hypothetical protein [Candidatus Woesearchaeota archaeon]
MNKVAFWVYWTIAVAFGIQSIVVSSAMIAKTLTVNWLAPQVTAAAGWITLVLVIIGLLNLLIWAVRK